MMNERIVMKMLKKYHLIRVLVLCALCCTQIFDVRTHTRLSSQPQNGSIPAPASDAQQQVAATPASSEYKIPGISEVNVVEKDILNTSAKCLGVCVQEGEPFGGVLSDIEQKYIPGLQQMMSDRKFVGKAGDKLIIPFKYADGIKNLFVVGLGSKKAGVLDIETYRRAVGSVVRDATDLKIDQVAIYLPSEKSFNCDATYLVQQTVVIADMAYYCFDQFITDKNLKYPHDLMLILVAQDHDKAQITEGIRIGKTCAQGVRKARYWIDLPSENSSPEEFVARAKELAQKHMFDITVFNDNEIKKMGMGGLSSVGQGSDRPSRFVVLKYTCKKEGAPTIGFAGKGVTFDSGGLNLKPTEAMSYMKDDKAGASIVLGAMDALGNLKPDVNIVCCIPLADNMPSGKAMKPGDIVTMYNGKTAEILNTDAEGRLILADAMAYMVKQFKLDAIIDLATLTGACRIALGPYYAAFLSKHDDLVARLQESSKNSGDRVWRLPLDDDYKAAFKTENADMDNTGSKIEGAGTIKGAMFLQNFVGDVPWVHLDIANVAFNVPNISYYRSGATGAGVRLLIDLAMNWK